MKVSDYIVNFFIKKGISDVFGYPGGMVTHLMDSFSKYENQIKAHVCYHEQAASFEACAYAQASNKVGVAYATSGPGATNMITGICNAYFDSVPVMFITGQVNTFESKSSYQIRQRGFQETNIVEMVKNVTKYSVYVDDANKIGYYLEMAYQNAITGRKGPVLLDIPMDIQRTEISLENLVEYKSDEILNFYKLLFSMIVLIIMMFIFRVRIGWNIFLVIPAYILVILLAFGIGMIFMHFGVYVDDLAYAVGILLQMLMFLSGEFYDVITSLPVPLNTMMICLNPIAMCIDSMRNALLYNVAANIPLIVVWMVIAVMLCYVGVHIVYKNENGYVKVV